MVDIILIHPPVSFKNKAWEKEIIPDTPHLGLLYLAAAAEKTGLTVKIIDATDGSYSPLDILEIIKKSHSKIVGITAMTMNIRGAVQLSKYLKENIKDTKIILGGPHVSADPTIIKRYPFFDIGMTGEADITFPLLARKIIDGNDEGIYGLYESKTPFDLDLIPHPSYHLVNFDIYRKRGFWANSIMASRGCPYHCSFCSITSISKKVRFRNPKNIIEEMEQLYGLTKCKYFNFVDDALTIKKSFVYELLSEMKNLSFKPRWEALSRVNYVNNDLLRAMREAGCYKLCFGVESGSERIRNDIIKKNVTDEQIKIATKLCWKNGIEPDHFLMLGFPTETKDDILKTIKCPLVFKPNIFGLHITQPFPGSSLFDEAIRQGIIEENVIDNYIDGVYGETFNGAWPKYIPIGSTYEDLIKARERAYKTFYFRPTYIIKRILRDFKSFTKLKFDIKNGLSLIIKGRSKNDYTQ